MRESADECVREHLENLGEMRGLSSVCDIENTLGTLRLIDKKKPVSACNILFVAGVCVTAHARAIHINVCCLAVRRFSRYFSFLFRILPPSLPPSLPLAHTQTHRSSRSLAPSLTRARNTHTHLGVDALTDGGKVCGGVHETAVALLHEQRHPVSVLVREPVHIHHLSICVCVCVCVCVCACVCALRDIDTGIHNTDEGTLALLRYLYLSLSTGSFLSSFLLHTTKTWAPSLSSSSSADVRSATT